ncbi:hypothetical protein NKH36_32400 [Mesorhizobium sp. M1312]|uniref:hypothetical protein n=1 Tax=unclassified Mesorhizobium TaxID=325217 RepID=UPI0033387425
MGADIILPSLLSDKVTAPPFRVQIAFDGNWMEACRFRPEELPSAEMTRQAVAGRETDVAVEFCFKLQGGDNFFFGERRIGIKNDPRAVEFVHDAISCGGPREWSGLSDFFSRLEGATTDRHGVEKGQFFRDLENVEVGITDWWHRGDVIEVWKKSDAAIPTEDQLREQLAQYPAIQVNAINFVCLEFNFRQPTHHWFGIEISNCERGAHKLDVSKSHPWLLACLLR